MDGDNVDPGDGKIVRHLPRNVCFDTREEGGEESRLSFPGAWKMPVHFFPTPSEGLQRPFFDVPWFRLPVFVHLTSGFPPSSSRCESLPPESHHVGA